jgi:hypothetical protein
MKSIPEKMTLMCLDDYKEGFGELARIVQGFEIITPESQKLYLKFAEQCLLEQLEVITQKKTEVIIEVREFLAKYNSQFKALLDTEKHLKNQLEHYKEIRNVITNENGQQTEERAAV